MLTTESGRTIGSQPPKTHKSLRQRPHSMTTRPQRNTFLAFFFTAVFFVAGSAKAQQITLSYTNTATVSGLNIFTNLSLTKFDSNLGLLDSVTVTIVSATLGGSFMIGAEGAIDQTYNSAAGRITIRQDPTNSLGYTTIGETSFDVTTTPAPGFVIQEFTTNTFTVDTPLLALSNSAQSINSSFFANYAQPGGGGQLAFQIKNRPDINITGGNFYLNAENFTLETKMAVTYTYTVPEPSTWALLALAGMGGVAALMRRRA